MGRGLKIKKGLVKGLSAVGQIDGGRAGHSQSYMAEQGPALQPAVGMGIAREYIGPQEGLWLGGDRMDGIGQI